MTGTRALTRRLLPPSLRRQVPASLPDDQLLLLMTGYHQGQADTLAALGERLDRLEARPSAPDRPEDLPGGAIDVEGQLAPARQQAIPSRAQLAFYSQMGTGEWQPAPDRPEDLPGGVIDVEAQLVARQQANPGTGAPAPTEQAIAQYTAAEVTEVVRWAQSVCQEGKEALVRAVTLAKLREWAPRNRQIPGPRMLGAVLEQRKLLRPQGDQVVAVPDDTEEDATDGQADG